MLHLFRRKKQGLKWVLWLVIFGLGAGMLLLFVGSPTGMLNTGVVNVGEVAGHRIPITEYQRIYAAILEQYRLSYGEVDPAILRQMGVPQQAMDQLLTEYAVNYGAEMMGISASPKEVVDYITTSPTFQQDGIFVGIDAYKQFLRAYNLDAQEYEESVRREVVRQKLSRVVTAGLKASSAEARQLFLDRNQEVKIRYAVFDPDELSSVSADEEGLAAYFEENRESYRTQELRKIKYATVASDPEAIQLSEQRIQEQLAGLSDVEEVRARHILLGPDSPETRSQGEEVLARLTAEEDFGELAKEFSTDTASAEQGGDLGFFKRGVMVPAFESAAFGLEAGQTSELVTTDFGIHIIRVEEVKTIDRRQEMETRLRQEESQEVARNQATKLIFEAQTAGGLDSVADRYAIDVVESDFFSLGDVIEGLGTRSDFNQQIFTLSVDQLREPYQVASGYVVAQLTEVQPSELSELDEVREAVTEDFARTQAEELALEKAFALAESAKTTSDFQALVSEQGVTLTETDLFKKDAAVDDTLGFATEVLDRAFRMSVDEISPAVSASGLYVVFQVVEKSSVDETQFEAERAILEGELTSTKQNQFFLSWINNVIQQLRDEEKIIIDQELVDSLLG